MEKKTKRTICLLLMISSVLSAYSQIEPLAKCKQVAKKVNGLTVCDRSQLKETVTIPLSALTENLQILKLDDADAALVKETATKISDNYILVKGETEVPFKLFDKKTGKFLTNIGSYGQGPNEYQLIYDFQLDEAGDRIYLMPWHAKKILVYDLKGKTMPAIPLCHDAPKGAFRVDAKTGTVIVSILPFKGVPAVVWQQTIDGKLLKSVAPGHIALDWDFSNEIFTYATENLYSLNVFSFVPRIDSLYNYNASANKLIPVFTLNFGGKGLNIHVYKELPNYYLGDLAEPQRISATTTVTQNQRYYIIDKQTLKGSFFILENDFLGNAEIGWPIFGFNDEYYVRNADPGNLKDELEKTLGSKKKLSPEMKTKLTKLKDSITDNDNNYILYAKLKK